MRFSLLRKPKTKMAQSLYLAATLSGMLGLQSAHAVVAENLVVDVRSMSMGNAAAADPTGVSAIHFNPAGLTHIQGLETNLQGVMLDFKITSDFEAPAGFNVFGYSDDPVVCEDDESVTDKICKNFKKGYSKTDGITLFIPVLDDMINLPKGIPTGLPLPSIAYNPPGSKFTYGTAFYAELAGGYNRAANDPGRFMGRQLAMERLVYASPTVAYQIDDNLSVGLGVKLAYSAVAMDTELRIPNELVGVFRFMDEEVCASFKENGNIITDLFLLGMCNAREGVGPFTPLGSMRFGVEDSASPAFNIGVLWEPSNDFALGLTYRSEAAMHLSGKFELQNGAAAQQLIRAMNSSATGSIAAALLGFPTNIPSVERGLAYSEMTLPKSVQAGLKYKLFPEMQFNVDAHWMDWGGWSALPIAFDRDVSVLQIAKLLTPYASARSLTLPLNYQSKWSMMFGWEYEMTDRLRFRLGYEPRKASIPLNKRSTLLPLNNQQLYGAGLGYSFDPQTEIDLGMNYIRSKDSIPAGSSSLSNQTGINNVVLNPYAGLNVNTKAEIFVLGINYRTRW